MEAVALFNRKAFFECHEVLEDLWRPLPPGAAKQFYQGVLQVGVGFYHLENGNLTGARNLLDAGLKKLQSEVSASFCCWIDLDKLIHESRLIRESLAVPSEKGPEKSNHYVFPKITLQENTFENAQEDTLPTLYYDSQCAMCSTAVRVLSQVGLLDTVHAASWQDSSNTDPDIAKQIRTEMVLVDPVKNSRYSGVNALVQLMSVQSQWKMGARLLAWAKPPADLVYKIFSYNRRVLFPPKMAAVACTCDPPFHLGYRTLLWAMLMTIAVGGSIIYGCSLGLLHPDRSVWDVGIQLTLAAGSGWAFNFIVFAALLGKRYWQFVEQCMIVMAIGIAFLMGIALINWIGFLRHWPQEALLIFNIVWVSLDSLLMFWAQWRRLSTLGFPDWALWLWLILLETAGIPLFIHFNWKQLFIFHLNL